MSKPTLKDVARIAGVSTTTASFVMTGKGRISDEIRLKVLSAAESLGYQRVKRLVSDSHAGRVIGVLFSVADEWRSTYGFVRPIIENIDRVLSGRGFQVVLIPINDELSPDEIFQRVVALQCRGLFTIHFGNESVFSRLEGRDIPVVLIMNGNFQNRYTTVCVDDYQGAYEGTHHLLQAGHRKLVFIDTEVHGLPNLSVDRFIGFRKAIEEFDVPLSNIEHLVYDRKDRDYLRSRISSIFSGPDRPTAIFALDDDLAARTISLLEEIGIRIPLDVSILAPGDLLDYSQEYCPQITTLRIDTGLMGTTACGLMENRLNRTNNGINVLKVKQQLVLRRSTLPYDVGILEIHKKKQSQLLPREKVLAAFNHIGTRMVPKWFGASQEFLAKAIRETGMDEEGLNRRLGNDFRRVESRLGRPGLPWRSPFGQDRRVPGYGQPVRKPLLERRTLEALRNYPWPDPEMADLRHIPAEAEAYHQEFAVLGGEWAPFWHDAIDFVGTQDLYYLMHDDPEFLLRLLDRIVDYYVAVTTRTFEIAGQNIDIFLIGNDFGGQSGPLMGLEQFDRFMVPSLKRLAELGHRYGKKVMLHSAGGIRPLLPSIIRSGIDAIHALQPDCAEMGAEGLKKDFGHRICLSGGIDAFNVLLTQTPEEVRRVTTAVLRIMTPGGGYVASPSHEALIEDTPVANVMAMFDAIRDFEADQA